MSFQIVSTVKRCTVQLLRCLPRAVVPSPEPVGAPGGHRAPQRPVTCSSLHRTPFHPTGSITDLQPLPAQPFPEAPTTTLQQVIFCETFLLPHRTHCSTTPSPFCPDKKKSKIACVPRNPTWVMLFPPRRFLIAHLHPEIRNCSEFIPGHRSCSLGTKGTAQPEPPLMAALFVRLTSVLAWPLCQTQSRQICVPGGSCSCAGALVAWKISQWSGLGWVWRRAQVPLGKLSGVLGNRLGTGHMWRAALSALELPLQAVGQETWALTASFLMCSSVRKELRNCVHCQLGACPLLGSGRRFLREESHCLPLGWRAAKGQQAASRPQGP